MTILDDSKPDQPDVILLADPVVNVERLERGKLAVVQIRLSWPAPDRPDMVLPLTVPTARLIAAALIDCAGPVDEGNA